MKQLEREMKGEDADATDDEVRSLEDSQVTRPNFNRKTFFRQPTQMSFTMSSRIVSAPSMLHVVELTSKPTENLKMTPDGNDSI
jgi:hypothetical protein